MATWLMTGARGFLGRHLLAALFAELEARGATANRVILLGRQRPEGWPEQAFATVDLDNPDALRNAVEEIAPDHVVHAAGRTPPATDEEFYQANFWGTLRLLNALRSLRRPVRVTVTGSAAELGPVPAHLLPISESVECNPTTAYGRSKWLATLAALAERSPLEVNVARLFNLVGPGLPASQALGCFADQLAVGGGGPLPIVVGDLDARRDFLDVRDAARALVILNLQGAAGRVYHVGSGESRPVREGLETLIRLSRREVRICVDPARIDRGLPKDSRADIARMVREIGWSPTVPFEKSVEDLWNERIERLRPPIAPSRALPLTA
jgi:nucleoside-diphosphate-sugar epimerase